VILGTRLGSTPTRFRQTADDSIALAGVRDLKTGSQQGVLFPFCSQLISEKEAVPASRWPLSFMDSGGKGDRGLWKLRHDSSRLHSSLTEVTR